MIGSGSSYRTHYGVYPFARNNHMGSRSGQAWYGAHDADRTRDLVLTKDVLYQLSYVGAFR